MNSSAMFLTRQEAAAVLRISLSSLDRMIEEGVLRVRRIGRRVLIPVTAINKLAEEAVR